jgi:succinate-semialdehyde dehydrogenase/glutarate-semialdehyde dehydrogenase
MEVRQMGMKLALTRNEAGDRIVSIDPATLEPIGEAPIFTREGVHDAVARARAAAPAWAARSFAERGALLTAAKDLVLAEADAIADLIARETGKTATGALASEVGPIVDLLGYFVKNAERMLAYETIPIRHWALLGRRSYLTYPPLGVVAVISPWNFPFSLALGTIAMGLVAGNCVVAKPSEVTPLVGLRIDDILRRAGVPADVFITCSGDGPTGAALVDSEVDKIFFTGSARTGRRIMEAAAKRLTPVSLELGGNAPMLILKDCVLENAVHGAVWGSFFNCGQVCASAQRLLVDRAIAPEFTPRFVEATKRVRLGTARAGRFEADVGCLTSEVQLGIVADLVEDARAKGARVLTGGRRREGLAGFFYEPTILEGVARDSRVLKEEVFGPVVCLATFDREDEAVKLANDTHYGLMASVWTRDIARGEEIARQIRSGTVVVNDHAMTHGIPETPWGGVRESGFGKTHGREGLLEFVEHRHIHVNRMPGVRAPWWFPESAATYRTIKDTAVALGGGTLTNRLAAGLRAAKSVIFGGGNGNHEDRGE